MTARYVETKLCEVCSQPVTFDAREVRQQTAKEIADWLDSQWTEAKEWAVLNHAAKLIREKYGVQP